MAVLFNWIAPSTLKQKTKVSHVDIASILLNEHPNNIGISLDPMFAYKKGGVWQAQKEMHDLLIQKSMIIDRSWTLLFKTKKDHRDTRPLAYHGRIIEGLTHNPKSPWKDTKIWGGYTDPAEQMCTKDMEQWQEIQPDSLPFSANETELVKGPLKMQQTGKDAAEKVLRALLDDMDLPGRSPLLIVDMNAIVGNFADAFLSVRDQINRPLY